jgi:hypothetical protein
VADTKTQTPIQAEDQQMCCEDGLTAEEHRKSSPDGKCCTD